MSEPTVELLLDFSSPKKEQDPEAEHAQEVESPSKIAQRNATDAANCIEAMMSEAEQAVRAKCVTPDAMTESAPVPEEVKLLEDEIFDFDLPASPDVSMVSQEKIEEKAANGDEDEVFFGPVGFTEKCLAVAVVEEENHRPPSPLTASQMVEIFKQAQIVAYHIESAAPKDKTHSDSSNEGGNPSQLGASVVRGKHERKGTFTMDIEDSEAVSGTRLPVSPGIPVVSLPEDEDGVIKFKAAPTTLLAPSPNKAKSPKKAKSGLVRRGTFRKSGPSTGKLPVVGSSPATALKAPVSRRISRTISPSKRQRTGYNESVDMVETASIASCESDLSSVSDISSGKRKLRTSRSGTSLMQPGSWSNTGTRGHHQRSASNSSRSSVTSSTSVASSCASISSLPTAAAKKPAVKKTLAFPKSAQSTSSAAAHQGSKSNAETPRSAVKPKTKPELLHQGNLPRKTLTVNRSKFGMKTSSIPAGPMKATAPVKATTSALKAPGPMKAIPAGGALQKPSARQVAPPKPLMPVKPLQAAAAPQADTANNNNNNNGRLTRASAAASLQGTPVKQQRTVQPKRILPNPDPTCGDDSAHSTPPPGDRSNQPATPGSVTSTKRRSFLPTPNKTRRSSISSAGSGHQRGSASSVGSLQSPAIGKLIDINGLDESSPSCLKSKKPPVTHTPLGNLNNMPKSIWSPIRRPKPISLEEAATQCTKRNAVNK